MRFSLDKAMGIHESALYVRARRSSVLASNLANSDTPNYKTRDIDFKSILQQAGGMSSGANIKATNAKHIIPGGNSAETAELLYRHPHQAAIDGNTVDAQIEKTKFAENSMMYQTSLNFLTGKIKALKSAIKGE